jgi:pantothenate kinase type III
MGKNFWEKQIAYYTKFGEDRIRNTASHSFSIVPCVVVAAGTFFTETLPSNGRLF